MSRSPAAMSDTDIRWCQSFIGLYTLATLSGLIYAGPNGSRLMKLLSTTVTGWEIILGALVLIAVAQMVLPFTPYLRLKMYANNLDMVTWCAILYMFFQVGRAAPVIFPGLASLLGNIVVLIRLSKAYRDSESTTKYTNP